MLTIHHETFIYIITHSHYIDKQMDAESIQLISKQFARSAEIVALIKLIDDKELTQLFEAAEPSFNNLKWMPSLQEQNEAMSDQVLNSLLVSLNRAVAALHLRIAKLIQEKLQAT